MICSLSNTYAQNSEKIEKLNVFLECNACDQTFIRTKVGQVNYVRDPRQAHVHAFVATQRTASGGVSYTINYYGMEEFEDFNNELTFDILPQATLDESRKRFVKFFRMGLVSYLVHTTLVEDIAIDLPEVKEEENIENQLKEDPWRNWVFRVGGGGNYRRESARSILNYDVNVEIDKVTPIWRIRTSTYMDFREQVFKDADGDITSIRNNNGFNGSVVRSISDHWSIGAFGGIYASTFRNIERSIYFSPALEYNIFSYDDVLQKEFTLAYKVGPSQRSYEELTIYNKMDELLFRQSLEIALRLRQPWGSVLVGLEGSNFFHDISKNSIEFNSNLSFRLIKGLAVNLRSNLEFIRDQLSLPAGDASIEDVLLSQRQLATNYESYLALGVSYTFGSIYNNVVNTRL